MSEKFGQTQTEEDLDKIMACRKIVQEIMKFGATQEQILLIIQFLGAELHRHEHMVEVVELARSLMKEDKVLLVDQAEEPANGSSNN